MLRLASCCLFMVTAGMFAAPPSPIQPTEYKERRDKLRKELGDSILIMMGRTEGEIGDLRTGFYQEPNFYYLTGWTEPGAMLVLTPSTEILLLPNREKSMEHWTGEKIGPDDPQVAKLTGFDNVASVQSLEESLPKWLSQGRRLLTLTDEPYADSLRKLAPAREVRNAAQAIARLRMKKSPAELALIRHSTDVGIEAHRAAWQRIKPGLFEYQIAATMSNAYFDRGCERHAYAPIVGSGKNGAILHYSRNARRVDNGELVLMDVGPECSMYATDITRTVPVNGKFTQRQREVYEAVLGAQKAALAAIKPGVMLGSRFNRTGLQTLVTDYLNDHGGLGKYFTHGLGHHVGLDVHDAFDPAMPLEAGMVITLEPGVYIPEEGIGVRIEDMVLVTENGAEVLSSKLPREIAEIEKIMATR